MKLEVWCDWSLGTEERESDVSETGPYHSGFCKSQEAVGSYFRFRRKPLEGFNQGTQHNSIYDILKGIAMTQNIRNEVRPPRMKSNVYSLGCRSLEKGTSFS